MKVESNKLGMALFVASEAFFFSLLILAYLYFQTASGGARVAQHQLDPFTTGAFSLCLIGSSLTIWLAGRSAKQGSNQRAAMWVTVTVLLGIVFLAGQGMEWSRLLGSGVTIAQGLFGTTFFTLTGFHGLHVLIGLLALSIFVGLSFSSHGSAPKPATLEVLSLYWHFVDVVWIVIFSVIYLRLVFA
jgi:heme/copper-type cytochrome/quinol oxidase subunit 3